MAGRKVKCHLTGESGTSDTFIKIGKHYYKSQEVFDAHELEMEYRNKILNVILNEFLSYKIGQPFPNIVNKKLNELTYYSYEVIYETIIRNSQTIDYFMTHKDFKNEFGRIAYIFAIVKNNIREVDEDIKRSKKRERVTLDLENAADLLNVSMEVAPIKQKNKNLLNMIGDDEI